MTNEQDIERKALRSYLCQQIFKQEFQRAYVRPELLTNIPLNNRFTSGTPCEVSKSHTIQDGLPDLASQLYYRCVRYLPFFVIQGEAYLQVLDEWVAHHFLTMGRCLIQATRFDILSFGQYYSIFMNEVKNEAIEFAHHQECHYMDYSIHTILPVKSTCSFRLHRPENGIPLDRKDSKLDETEYSVQFDAFVTSWREFYWATARLFDEMKQDGVHQSSAYADYIFGHLKECERIEDLPTVFQEWLEAAIVIFAHTIDNVLDDATWRAKMQYIYRRLPISVMVTSMRFINPIPFVERVLKLFLWRPGGMHSLLQKFGSTVSAHGKTLSELKSMHSRVPKDMRRRLEHTVTEYCKLYSTLYLSSQSSRDELQAFLQQHQLPVSDHYVDYTRLLFRCQEKQAFIDILGSDHLTLFITHIAKIFPPILSEVYECIDFADLTHHFFHTMGKILEALKEYDVAEKEKRLPKWHHMMNNLKKTLRQFVAKAFPLAKHLAKKQTRGHQIHYILNEWLRTCCEPQNHKNDFKSPLFLFAKNVDAVLADVPKHVVDQLIANIKSRKTPSEKEADEVVQDLVVSWTDVLRRELMGKDEHAK